MQLKDYQEKAVAELLQKARSLLSLGGKTLVFKAPVGSGKTVCIAEFLKQLADDPADRPPLSFIWTAPRDLHTQSKDKLDTYFENSRALECSFFEDLNDKQIGENEILFFNWESINKSNAIYIRESEEENNLSKVLERTRDDGRKIVLIIDESHFAAGTRDKKEESAARKLRQDIAPDLTIEVSATPRLQGDDSVNIQIENVKNEAMIKRAAVLNEGFKNAISNERITKDGGTVFEFRSDIGSTDEKVLDEAIKKRTELVRRYKAAGIAVNPLLLIQLPDKRGQEDENLALRVERALKDKHGISIENRKLAIKLSGRVENWENIERTDGEQEVLIFKHSIALGWDCPRAQILALFREWKSAVFSVQTVGRIMRMPEPEHGKYYADDVLNYAYVYTDLESVEIKEDISDGYVAALTSTRIRKYEQIILPSVHRERHREQTRLATSFIGIFLNEAKKYTHRGKKGLKNSIKLKGQKADRHFISDEKPVTDIDAAVGKRIEGKVSVENANEMTLHTWFSHFAREVLSPQFYPEDRSVGRIKESVYAFFEKQLDMDYADRFSDIINIVLSEKNRPHFLAVIEMAKLAYIDATKERAGRLTNSIWDVPEWLPFGDGYEEDKRVEKSVLMPFYYRKDWQSETSFINFLEKPDNDVVWWFKNGSRDATGTFFAVPYKDGSDRSPFYVDFVVMMKDGSIGLFDPHSIHLTDFGAKSDGLQAYISELQKKGRKVSGGIVANTDRRNFKGQWIVYEGTGNPAKEGNRSDWAPLEI